jgi:hypothetical protein
MATEASKRHALRKIWRPSYRHVNAGQRSEPAIPGASPGIARSLHGTTNADCVREAGKPGTRATMRVIAVPPLIAVVRTRALAPPPAGETSA